MQGTGALQCFRRLLALCHISRTASFALFSKLWATSAVVDEPVTDLGHADAGQLKECVLAGDHV